jgi:hypothetical protein
MLKLTTLNKPRFSATETDFIVDVPYRTRRAETDFTYHSFLAKSKLTLLPFIAMLNWLF